MNNKEASEALTEDIYQFICCYLQKEGIAPSHREIAAACFVSKTSVIHHLDRLEKWGRISRTEGRARSIRLLPQKPEKK